LFVFVFNIETFNFSQILHRAARKSVGI